MPETIPSETAVFLKIKEGDESAYESVFREHYSSLCNYARKFLARMEDAEEIVQDVFVKVWEKREGLDIKTSFKSYLYRSVHNLCLNQIQHQKVRKTHADHTLAAHQDESDTTAVETAELEDKIAVAIRKLPEKCREVFELSRFEHLKYAEIAEKRNISIKTVENQMGKAFKILREELAEFMPLWAIVILKIMLKITGMG